MAGETQPGHAGAGWVAQGRAKQTVVEKRLIPVACAQLSNTIFPSTQLSLIIFLLDTSVSLLVECVQLYPLVMCYIFYFWGFCFGFVCFFFLFFLGHMKYSHFLGIKILSLLFRLTYWNVFLHWYFKSLWSNFTIWKSLWPFYHFDPLNRCNSILVCFCLPLLFFFFFAFLGKAYSWMCLQGTVWRKLVQHLLIQPLQTWRQRDALLCGIKQRWDSKGRD